MAETLGTLVDKLAIVDLKLWHCQEALETGAESADMPALQTKNDSLLVQRQRLIDEIDRFFGTALDARSSAELMSPQNKMYGRFRTE